MNTLPRYTLSFNSSKNNWQLKKEVSGTIIKSFPTKSAATASGVLRSAFGKQGASVRIKKLDGTFQEERTYPRSADPKKSKG